ncbi:MAG: spondin domain-containing protein [Proteobacteria bacterium]|nr:spondin domain-containing protein [Pseudomonadota bacterium]
MKKLITLLAASLLISSAAWGAHNGARTYEVTVTNLSKGLNFTPFLAATHNSSVVFFKLGQPASDALADLAEGGDTGPLEMMLLDNPDNVFETATTSGLQGPGETVSFMIEADNSHNRISLAGMLLPTNDTIVAINSMRLPKSGKIYYASAYDAGTEKNDELCANIPGPTCGGEPFSEGQAEGYVYIGNGIHGNADLSTDKYDWRNPVARVAIHLVK